MPSPQKTAISSNIAASSDAAAGPTNDGSTEQVYHVSIKAECFEAGQAPRRYQKDLVFSSKDITSLAKLYVKVASEAVAEMKDALQLHPISNLHRTSEITAGPAGALMDSDAAFEGWLTNANAHGTSILALDFEVQFTDDMARVQDWQNANKEVVIGHRSDKNRWFSQ